MGRKNLKNPSEESKERETMMEKVERCTVLGRMTCNVRGMLSIIMATAMW
jgi:hypothetical protein